MPFRWSARTAQTVSASALSALLLFSAGKHFREPEFFDQVVPDVLCRDDTRARPNGPLAVLSREEWIALSGLLEAGAAAGLLVPATRRAAAGCVTAMFTLFLAGHIDALRKACGPDGTPRRRRAHTVRLPVQAPLIAWAWSLTKPVLRNTAPGNSAVGPRP
ncbi:DoxX family protein [Arthrobacter sp. RHLT1-20]